MYKAQTYRYYINKYPVFSIKGYWVGGPVTEKINVKSLFAGAIMKKV